MRSNRFDLFHIGELQFLVCAMHSLDHPWAGLREKLLAEAGAELDWQVAEDSETCVVPNCREDKLPGMRYCETHSAGPEASDE